MKHYLLLFNLYFAITSVSFSQGRISNDSTLFSNGIKLEDPNGVIPWEFELKDVENLNLRNFQVSTKKSRTWQRMEFDSITFLMEYLLTTYILHV